MGDSGELVVLRFGLCAVIRARADRFRPAHVPPKPVRDCVMKLAYDIDLCCLRPPLAVGSAACRRESSPIGSPLPVSDAGDAPFPRSPRLRSRCLLRNAFDWLRRLVQRVRVEPIQATGQLDTPGPALYRGGKRHRAGKRSGHPSTRGEVLQHLGDAPLQISHNSGLTGIGGKGRAEDP